MDAHPGVHVRNAAVDGPGLRRGDARVQGLETEHPRQQIVAEQGPDLALQAPERAELRQMPQITGAAGIADHVQRRIEAGVHEVGEGGGEHLRRPIPQAQVPGDQIGGLGVGGAAGHREAGDLPGHGGDVGMHVDVAAIVEPRVIGGGHPLHAERGIDVGDAETHRRQGRLDQARHRPHRRAGVGPDGHARAGDLDVLRGATAAHMIGGLDHRHLPAGTQQVQRGGEARQARAHHDDVPGIARDRAAGRRDRGQGQVLHQGWCGDAHLRVTNSGPSRDGPCP